MGRLTVAFGALIFIVTISDASGASRRSGEPVIVVRSLTSRLLLQVENLRLDSAPPEAPQPSAILKFDLLNDASVRLTDVVMKISFLQKRQLSAPDMPARVMVGPVTVRVREILQAGFALSYEPRWTVENRQFVDSAKPAISPGAETSEFYFVPSSVRKSVWSFVRQLRGPHLSTCA
jgi:hypothetical protein